MRTAVSGGVASLARSALQARARMLTTSRFFRSVAAFLPPRITFVAAVTVTPTGDAFLYALAWKFPPVTFTLTEDGVPSAASVPFRMIEMYGRQPTPVFGGLPLPEAGATVARHGEERDCACEKQRLQLHGDLGTC